MAFQLHLFLGGGAKHLSLLGGKKMNNRVRYCELHFKTVLVGVAASLVACSPSPPLDPLNKKLSSETPSLSVEADFCTTPDYEKETHLKMVVVLDKSGSNMENYEMNPNGTPRMVNGTINLSPEFATDPTGQMRYGRVDEPGTLLNYLDQKEQDPLDPRHHFALVEFSTGVTTYPLGSSGFTSDIDAFQAVVEQRANAGGGWSQ